jgi:hypothetical protein
VTFVPASFSYGRGRWDKTDDACLVLGAAITTEKPLLHRALPKPSCLALADPQYGGNLSHRTTILAVKENGAASRTVTRVRCTAPARLSPGANRRGFSSPTAAAVNGFRTPAGQGLG